MHANTVIIDNKGILIRGRSGSGKTTLALRLIEDAHFKSCFAGLVSDDQTILTRVNGELLARCPDAIAGKIEIRGYGILKYDRLPSAVIHLVVDLVNINKMERMPHMEFCKIKGVKLSRVSVPYCQETRAARIISAMLVQG